MASSSYRGVSAESDFRFSDTAKQSLKHLAQKAPPSYATKVYTSKICRPVVSNWVAQRVTQLLGIEDEVVIGLVNNSLEQESPNPLELQLTLTGFLEKRAPAFVAELWDVLLSAQVRRKSLVVCENRVRCRSAPACPAPLADRLA